MKAYKIGIIGFGSIGRRHLSNIITVLKEKKRAYSIDLIRSGKGKEIDHEVAKQINKIYYEYDEVPDDYDILFITNVTSLHLKTIKQYSKKTKNMFIEKPVFDSDEVLIEELGLSENGIYYVACPLRYTNVIEYLKNNLKMEEVISIRAICSSYLPDWRADQDYRLSYSADKERGGGVSLDLIHEWDYLTYLFGMPEQIFSIGGKFSDLVIDSEDLSIYIAKYPTLTAEVHLDYFGRQTIRQIQVFTNEDTIEGDLVNSEIRYLTKGTTVSFEEDRNDYQYKEMLNFFDMIEGKTVNENDINHALTVLKIAKGGA